MAKKLKYPYEQWKQEQQEKNGSRSPSPAPEADLERSNQLSQNSSGQLDNSHSKSHVYIRSP